MHSKTWNHFIVRKQMSKVKYEYLKLFNWIELLVLHNNTQDHLIVEMNE